MFQTTNQIANDARHWGSSTRICSGKNIFDTTKQKSFSPSWFPEFLHGRLPPHTKLAPFSLATLGSSIGVRWSQPEYF